MNNYQDIIEDWAPTAVVAGAGVAFNVAAYALDSVFGAVVMIGLPAVVSAVYAIDELDDMKAAAASVLVAIGTLYGASMTANDRKVCFVSPGEELTATLSSAVNNFPAINEQSMEPNKMASRIIFDNIGAEGTKLPYTTEPSIFSGFTDGGRVCPKVGRIAQRAFNADGFDQTGTIEHITAEWTEKYSKPTTPGLN
jgi:hypothetical protein